VLVRKQESRRETWGKLFASRAVLSSVPLHQEVICSLRKGSHLLSLLPVLFSSGKWANPEEDGIAGTKGESWGVSFKTQITCIKPEQKEKVRVTELWF